MSILTYLLFFGILGVIIYGDSKKKFLAFFAGTILFPNVCLFIKNPSISPQHIFLYLYILVEFFQDSKGFNIGLTKHPLRIPLIILIFSYVSTAIFNGGIASIDMYYGIRDLVDTFGYIVVAYIVGKKISTDEFAESLMPFVIFICVCGVGECLLNANYPYKLICSAFPSYDGLYNLDTSVSLSQSWRFRSCFTTKHPTAFGTLLMTLFLFYLPYIRRQQLDRPRLYLTLVLLALNIFLCGSRTALVCTVVGVFLLVVDKINIYLKIFTWGMLIFCSTMIMAFMIARFGQSTGSGSSLDFRAQQLIYSVLLIEDKPVFGNGNKFASHNLFEENDKGQVRAEDSQGNDMGGLESVAFTLLIDRGFVGFFSYYLLLLWLLIIFYYNRKRFDRHIGTFVIVISGTVFLTLSGSIGNSSAFIFAILGLELGNIEQEKQKLDEGNKSQLELPATDLH